MSDEKNKSKQGLYFTIRTSQRHYNNERERERDHRNQIKSIDTIKYSSVEMKYL